MCRSQADCLAGQCCGPDGRCGTCPCRNSSECGAGSVCCGS
jgi:hypothetical protein